MANKRSPDFRFYPCTAVGFGLSGDAARIMFTIDEGDGNFLEQAGAIVPIATLAVLQVIISEAVAIAEENGQIKPVPEEMKKSLIKDLRAAIQTRPTA